MKKIKFKKLAQNLVPGDSVTIFDDDHVKVINFDVNYYCNYLLESLEDGFRLTLDLKFVDLSKL